MTDQTTLAHALFPADGALHRIGCEVLSFVPARPEESHKGTFGSVLIAAGSVGMAGAAYLAARAAYRCGAGLVRIASCEENRVILQTLIPEAVWLGSDRKTLLASHEASSVTVLGPGLGQSRDAADTAECLLHHLSRPLILDADGLNLLSRHPAWIPLIREAGVPVTITPHAGEAARLLRCDIVSVTADPESAAVRLADSLGVICVLKGHETVTATPDGTRFRNTTGNSALAKGGSGDVLTGVIAALIAQGTDPASAAITGVCLHGLAGEKASEQLGEYGVLASDIADAAAQVLAERKN